MLPVITVGKRSSNLFGPEPNNSRCSGHLFEVGGATGHAFARRTLSVGEIGCLTISLKLRGPNYDHDLHRAQVFGVYWILVGVKHKYLGVDLVLVGVKHKYLGVDLVLVGVKHKYLEVNRVLVGVNTSIWGLFGYS